MSEPYQADHEGEGLGELLSQLQAKPKITALVAALLGPVQALEDNLSLLRLERLLSTALGAQLDQYGLLVGEARGSLLDATYRLFIQARILANLSEGNADRMIEVFRLIAGPQTAGTAVEYRQVGTGPEFSLTIHRAAALAADIEERVVAEMDDICPAGVGCKLVVASSGGFGAFRFDSGPGFDKGRLASIIP